MTFDITDERAVLGCALIDGKCALRALSGLQESDFTDTVCAEAFVAMKKQWNKDGRVDVVTMSRTPYGKMLLECADTVPSLSGCDAYIAHVKEHAMQMRAAVVGIEIATGTLSAEELCEKVAELARLTNGGQTSHAYTMAEMLTDFLARHIPGEKPSYIEPGMGLNKRTHLRGGDMVIIGARPSVGKTAYSLQMALNLSRTGKRVVYFSLETGKETVIDRIVACACGHDYGAIQENAIDFTTPRAAKEMDILSKYNILVRDKLVEWTTAAIEAEALRLGADVVMVDYLGLVSSKGNSIYEQTTNASKEFHRMAQKNKFLLVLLCQISRAGSDAPKMEYLRDSGQIEQDADVIILLHDTKDDGYAAIVAKNKNGSCGAIRMVYDKAKQRFSEVDSRYES